MARLERCEASVPVAEHEARATSLQEQLGPPSAFLVPFFPCPGLQQLPGPHHWPHFQNSLGIAMLACMPAPLRQWTSLWVRHVKFATLGGLPDPALPPAKIQYTQLWEGCNNNLSRIVTSLHSRPRLYTSRKIS